jgi:peptide/nickel transport system ATP-binding protein
MGETGRIFDNPLHPYTQMLMASVPRLDKKWEEEGMEIELRANQSETTRGCVYYGRCPVAETVCARHRPALLEVERDHFVACVRYAEG